jgi:hypothetical protein
MNELEEVLIAELKEKAVVRLREASDLVSVLIAVMWTEPAVCIRQGPTFTKHLRVGVLI